MFGAEKIGRRHQKPDPTVSVVVPVRNSPRRIATCIEALLVQTYPKDRVRIVIVDNDSDDDTRRVVERYPVELVVEKTAHNPYVARNAGVALATGEIIAFTDANCVPAEDWLTRGVRTLLDRGADLAGGRVTFTFSARPTVGEVVDAMTNVDVEASIANHRACMTGNLFVRRAVFAEVGAFDPSLRSGGDMRWTRRATDAGFRLVYAADAEVSYPARPLGPLVRKQYRVGRGVPGVWEVLGVSRPQMVVTIARGMLPTPPSRFATRVQDRVTVAVPDRLVRLWLGVWLCKLVRAVGCVDGMLRQQETHRHE
jgi:glycosyltransferase involved in cell wall biosynthesis